MNICKLNLENIHMCKVWTSHLYPDTFDVIKDQGSCGSCWAFAAAAVMDSAIYRMTGMTRLWIRPALCVPCKSLQSDTSIADNFWFTVNDFCPELTWEEVKVSNDYTSYNNK